MRWLKQWAGKRRTNRQRLARLEKMVDDRDSRISSLEATVAAYERAVAGDGPTSGLR